MKKNEIKKISWRQHNKNKKQKGGGIMEEKKEKEKSYGMVGCHMSIFFKKIIMMSYLTCDVKKKKWWQLATRWEEG